jgi:hypothetical protein
MRFHLPSFLLGAVAGASGALLAPRLRPLALELATGCYRMLDAAMVKIARGRESVSDLLAEARTRARGALQAVPPYRVGDVA